MDAASLAEVAKENLATGAGRKVQRGEVPCGLLGCGKQGTLRIIQYVKLRPSKPEAELFHERCDGHLDRLPNLLPWWELVREEIEEIQLIKGIRCGACRGKHRDVAAVKACSSARNGVR